jgi:hypothetical protein
LDSVTPGFAELNSAAAISSSRDTQDPHAQLQELCGVSADELWQSAEAGSVGLGKDELARVLLAIGVKYNYGMAPGVSATRTQIAAFWRSLQLRDLALAQACALGSDAAWQQFMAIYKEPLTQAAIGITRSATLGQELADSFCSTMFGCTGRDGERRSPLAYYSGRGSFKGFLRAACPASCGFSPAHLPRGAASRRRSDRGACGIRPARAGCSVPTGGFFESHVGGPRS